VVDSVELLPAIPSSVAHLPPSLPTQVHSIQELPEVQLTLLLLTQILLSRYPVTRVETIWQSSRHTGQAIPKFPTTDRQLVAPQAKFFLRSLAGSTHGQHARICQPQTTPQILLRESPLCSGEMPLESSVGFSTSGSRIGRTTGQMAKAQPRSAYRHT